MAKILITGATDGIGLETAKSLVSTGHHLLVHGRSSKKLDKIFKVLKAVDQTANIGVYQADLSLLSEVNAFAEAVKRDHQKLDVIINNAGVLKTPEPITADGMDVRFVVNTISPYVIAKELLPLLAEDGRIINLSSAAQAPVNLDALSGKVRIGDDIQAYAQSKLAMTIWSQELAKRIKPNQVIIAVNPGSLLASKMVKEGFGMAGNDINIGAGILVRASLSVEFADASGKYFDNDAKRFSLPHEDAQNQDKCEKIMAIVEMLAAGMG
jgi:NAD(P)-dependent dehydrogenase (short-subunit alcohol dehydrogenase family)